MQSPFTPVLAPTTIKPASQWYQGKALGLEHTLANLKDWLSTPAWLELGAVLFIPVYLILHPFLGAYVLLLPVAALAYRIGTALAKANGLLHNDYMDDVIPIKTAAQIPDPVTGEFGPEPTSEGVCVILLGVKNNHPLGLLAPGFKEMGGLFQEMADQLEASHASEYGFLGQSSWVEQGGRASQNQIMTVQYFRDSVGLNKFAHSKLHIEGMAWWNKHAKQYPHLGLFHEVFEAPAGAWEGIYLQSKPLLLGKSGRLLCDPWNYR